MIKSYRRQSLLLFLAFGLALPRCALFQEPAPEPVLTKPAPVVIEAAEAKKPALEPAGPAKAIPEEAPYTDEHETALIENTIEACDAAKEFWKNGELENALAALDVAYGRILTIDTSEDPNFLQQRDDLRLLIARRIVEIYASQKKTVGNNGKEIPIIINAHVEAEIKRFQNQGLRSFKEAYRRSGRYRALILEELEAAGLPLALSWLPLIESSFKVKAYSRARALGLWQFIPSTGYRYDLKRDLWIDERMDPLKSTRAAIQYLSELHGLFGDWSTALAAYNCGEGNVLRAIRAQKINYLDDFWDLYLHLPSETARYLPKFLATLAILEDPDAYGVDLPEPDPPLYFESVRVEKPARLSDIAKAYEIPLTMLTGLNPELRHASTPDRPYSLRVPPAFGTKVTSMLVGVPRWVPPQSQYVIHRVRSGETISQIADRHRTSIKAIARLNSLGQVDRIYPGQKLKIPVRGASGAQAGAAEPPSNAVVYRVRPGDTLYDIAQRHGMSLNSLMRYNGLTKYSVIYPDQELWVVAK